MSDKVSVCSACGAKLPEIDRLRAEIAELSQKTAAILDHYLACYDGNEDKLAIETRAILAKIASHQPASDQEPQKSS